jgi:RimJ/RimL family protein N-acetyltransferase
MGNMWPPFDLRIVTPRVELRLARDDELVELAQLAAAGIHPPDEMPFAVPWTREPSPRLERGFLQFHWRMRSALTPESWSLPFACFVGGTAVGTQDIGADEFAIRRHVSTGSWLGAAHQRQGIGTEMRAAVLHLAFDGLGAESAESSASEDNPASIGVSRALGYGDDGCEVHAIEGRRRRMRRFVLERERWLESRRDDIRIEGLDACRELLGA